jgi:3-oxoacyl-[acyl-carrier protein] reductase
MVFTMQAFLPFMQSAGGGRIVLISSIAGLAASPTAALPYSVSKAAVAALPRLLAPQLAQINVLINAVAPSKFENESWAVSPYETKSYLDSVPLRRLASGAEVAALVGFLGSRSNTYITGQTIVHDGGRLCGWEPISV